MSENSLALPIWLGRSSDRVERFFKGILDDWVETRLHTLYDQNSKLQELKQCVEKEARIRLCVNTPVQKAGVEALTGSQDHIKEMVARLRKRRDYAWKKLN